MILLYKHIICPNNFKIIYRIQDFDLRIIRIFHTSLDPAKLLDID